MSLPPPNNVEPLLEESGWWPIKSDHKALYYVKRPVVAVQFIYASVSEENRRLIQIRQKKRNHEQQSVPVVKKALERKA